MICCIARQSVCLDPFPARIALYSSSQIDLELQKQITKYLTRVQTLPTKHPTKIWLLKAVRYWRVTNSKLYLSNMEHQLVKQYPDYAITEAMEEIHPYIKPPWWSLTNAATHITNIPKESAKEEHIKLLNNNNTQNVLNIYTDGSGIESHIGAAAHSTATSASVHYYLGKTDTAANVVYATDLVTAIHLGLINMTGKSHELFDQCSISQHFHNFFLTIITLHSHQLDPSITTTYPQPPSRLTTNTHKHLPKMSSPPVTNSDNGWNLKGLVKKMKDNILAPVTKFYCYGWKAVVSTVIFTTLFLIAWSFALGRIFFSWGYWWYALSAICGIAFFNCLNTGSKRLGILYPLVLSAGFVAIRVSDTPWQMAYCSGKTYQLPASSPDGTIQLQHIQLTSCRRHFFSSNYSIGETQSDNHTYINLIESTHLDAETKLRSFHSLFCIFPGPTYENS